MLCLCTVLILAVCDGIVGNLPVDQGPAIIPDRLLLARCQDGFLRVFGGRAR